MVQSVPEERLHVSQWHIHADSGSDFVPTGMSVVKLPHKHLALIVVVLVAIQRKYA